MGKKNRGALPRKHEVPRKNNSAPLIVMGIILVGLFIWIVTGLAGSPSAPQADGPLAEEKDGIQVVIMNLSTAGYNPNSFMVKKGLPVMVRTTSTADAGCVRGIMIPDFGVNVALDTGSDTFTFTPDKTGTFRFTCQMKMSSGTIKVI
ncbi:MAG: hypothetical protein CVU89_06895 [Firmicutes bacterium HGW-Firmicutes-14]|nr:MAG: hypothetical protein CVU89_06895 [Firmicutes bacterium HGW-Firmicutes-14]